MGTTPTAPVLHSARTQGRVNLTTVGEVYYMMGPRVKRAQTLGSYPDVGDQGAVYGTGCSYWRRLPPVVVCHSVTMGSHFTAVMSRPGWTPAMM